MAKIVFTTFGSLGDLHPMMALALEMKTRGHECVIATHELYRNKIENEGLEFYPLRPHLDPEDKDLISRVLGNPEGSQHLTREVLMPALRHTFDDVAEALRGADLLVNHMLVYAGPHAAEFLRVPWVSVALSPICLFSAYDPPTLPDYPLLNRLLRTGPFVTKVLLRTVQLATRQWAAPAHQLRRELGLPPTARDPLGEGLHSPALVLGLFSQLLAQPQRDWPAHTQLTGFPRYDKNQNNSELTPELESFLNAGPAPIVFTLGSAAVMSAGDFYTSSAKAAQTLGRRAVLLVGKDPTNRPLQPLSSGIGVFNYAPYSKLFPRAAAIVHQGGIGTTGQALASGRPQLVVPYGIDQPDNAARLQRLGLARVLPRRQYTSERAIEELQELFTNPAYAHRAERVGQQVQREESLQKAGDALERFLGVTPDQTPTIMRVAEGVGPERPSGLGSG
ncbi:MAG: glycosyltransferase family 1 protein [Bdellovibrionales bacterium]|nr:glycosyltransferase family 1 protein [Bdellovibrionales bacterium]